MYVEMLNLMLQCETEGMHNFQVVGRSVHVTCSICDVLKSRYETSSKIFFVFFVWNLLINTSGHLMMGTSAPFFFLGPKTPSLKRLNALTFLCLSACTGEYRYSVRPYERLNCLELNCQVPVLRSGSLYCEETQVPI